MKYESTDLDQAVKEVLDVITKHKLTFAEYKGLKDTVDRRINDRIIGNKKA